MKTQILRICLLLMVLAVSSACTAGTSKNTTQVKPGSHPALTDQEKLTPCAQCHKDVTPDLYQQWYDSVHGIANVKCFQCHGTYENFRVEPDETNCAACHNAQYLKRPKDKKCWVCHPAHNFFAHK